MAQGDFWKMGVGLWWPNHSMQEPSAIHTTLNANALAGTTTLNCVWQTFLSPYYQGGFIRHYLRKNDVVTVGPSSHTANPGKVEEIQVHVSTETDSNNNIFSKTALIYSYLAGDQIQAVGTALPGGWQGSVISTGTADIVSAGIDRGGVKDPYSLSFISTTGGYLYSVRRQGPTVDPFAKYYLACYCKYLGIPPVPISGPAEIWFYVDNDLRGVMYLNAASTPAGGTYSGSTWLEVKDITDVVTSGYMRDYESIGGAAAHWRITAGGAGQYSYAVDHLVACHASGTTDVANGIWTMNEYPQVESVRIHHANDGIAGMNLQQDRQVQHEGGARVKHVINARFENVNQTFYDNLQVLLAWQRRNNRKLLLRPSIDDLPPYMYGVLKVTDERKDHWDFRLRSLDVQFVEV